MVAKKRKATASHAEDGGTTSKQVFRRATSEETMLGMLTYLEQGARQEDRWDPGGRTPTPEESQRILDEITRIREAITANDVHLAAYRSFVLGQVFSELSTHLPALDTLVPLARQVVKQRDAQQQTHAVDANELKDALELIVEYHNKYPEHTKYRAAVWAAKKSAQQWVSRKEAARSAAIQAARTTREKKKAERMNVNGISYKTILSHLPAYLEPWNG